MWARVASLAVGIWLMAAPALLGYDDPARAVDRVIGPIAASAAVVALSEAARALRWLEVAVGLMLVVAPAALDYPAIPSVNSVLAGVVLVTCGVVRGRMTTRIGGGWSAIVHGRRSH
jgi:hypothetical protein